MVGKRKTLTSPKRAPIIAKWSTNGERKMLSKLAVRRLTKLADYMDSLPASANEHFDIYSRGPLRLSGKRDLLKCGTPACAMGWAGTIRSFRRAGWVNGWRDEEEFFDISRPDAWHLFYCEKKDAKTPQQWTAHCRKFLRNNA